MVDEDPEPDPKPLVDYAYIDEYVEEKPDILDLYEKQDRLARGFGKKGPALNKEIIQEIHNIHKRPELKEFYVPYDLDMDEGDKNLIGPPIPKDFNPNYQEDEETDYSNKPNNQNDNTFSKKILKNVNAGRQNDSLTDESMNSEDEEEEAKYSLENSLPISHLVELNHSEYKAVNSLDIDRSGNRLITGSFDGTVKIWDFNNLTRRPTAFQTIECCEGFPVLATSWAPSGGFFLACTGDCQAKVYDRDGNFEIGCLKGDNYLHDINNTKGHTYPLTDGKFHPKERNLFITSSRDSTIREWDIYSKPMGIDQEIMQSTVLRAKTFKHHKITVNSCAYSNDGSIIIGGVNDGSIQFWYKRSTSWKPELYIQDAHIKDSEITAVKFFDDGIKFVSRSSDSTMKLWDLRRINKAIFTWDNLPSFSVNTGVGISPDESMVFTGTSVKKGHENSHLNFYSTFNFEKVKSIPVCRNSIVCMSWNDKINQIAVGSTDGIVRMYFNPITSKNGIVNSIYKKAKTKEIDDIDYMKPIITPLVLPLFDEEKFSREVYQQKINPEDEPKHKAELPEQGPGSRFARNPSVTQSIMYAIHRRIYDEGDPRNVLLKFREKEGQKGVWVDSAYPKTQPKPVFDTRPPTEDEVQYYEQSEKKKCPACGLKFCQCNKSIFQLPIPKNTKPKPKNV